MMHSNAPVLVSLLLAAVWTVAACGPASPSAVPTARPPVASGSSGSQPPGPLAWPAEFGVELTPGRYAGSPPFDVSFTVEVGERGWYTGHLHAEFFDLLRFDGLTLEDLPNRMVAFAHPTMVRLASGNEPATGLAPADAIAGLAARPDLVTSNQAPLELFGRPSVRIDLHADVSNTTVFGGPVGNFGMGPEREVRLVAMALDSGLLLVLVLAEADDLEAAWEEALRILETIEL
jgi:hypothetical protein